MPTKPLILDHPNHIETHVIAWGDSWPETRYDPRFKEIAEFLEKKRRGLVKCEFLMIIKDGCSEDPRWVLKMKEGEDPKVVYCKNKSESDEVLQDASHFLAKGVAMYEYHSGEKTHVKSILENGAAK